MQFLYPCHRCARSVLIETSLGELTIDLFFEETPLAAKNFLKLCKLKYYNGCLFFNVQRDFIAQCGDPTATGAGGQSVYGCVVSRGCFCLLACSPVHRR
jgi:cyclophilin family peptidyl-prolyl cis-trans isomerase